jgi:hypothetical protein
MSHLPKMIHVKFLWTLAFHEDSIKEVCHGTKTGRETIPKPCFIFRFPSLPFEHQVILAVLLLCQLPELFICPGPVVVREGRRGGREDPIIVTRSDPAEAPLTTRGRRS